MSLLTNLAYAVGPPLSTTTTARTYTSAAYASLFCKRPGSQDHASLVGAVQAGSMDFLASQGFDFNKWVHSGVPFMRLSERDRCGTGQP